MESKAKKNCFAVICLPSAYTNKTYPEFGNSNAHPIAFSP